jgi:hypothetical protein
MGSRELSTLAFTATTNEPSAIVPLSVFIQDHGGVCAEQRQVRRAGPSCFSSVRALNPKT